MKHAIGSFITYSINLSFKIFMADIPCNFFLHHLVSTIFLVYIEILNLTAIIVNTLHKMYLQSHLKPTLS